MRENSREIYYKKKMQNGIPEELISIEGIEIGL